MSEQTAEQTTGRESRAQRAARLAAEQTPAPTPDAPTPDGSGEQDKPEPDLVRLAALVNSDDMTDEDKAAFVALTDKQKDAVAELRAVAAVEGFAAVESAELRNATVPVRNRKPVQKAMDKVAAKAYADWIEAGRPTTWSRMPSITYFLDPEQVADYRKWIRAAVGIISAEPYEKDGKTVEPSGVRVRFGGDFVLTEKMAEKIGKPDKAGKTVLAWAAIDKRHVTGTNGNDD